jgi:beta-galactosidase
LVQRLLHGREQGGYNNFRYDVTDYLLYDAENVVVVRVNATLEEGWFYEGAGIYRHVWLTKTAPLHVGYDGVFVRSEVKDGKAMSWSPPRWRTRPSGPRPPSVSSRAWSTPRA